MEQIKEILESAIKTNNILHSYLFVGTEGIGKSIFNCIVKFSL